METATKTTKSSKARTSQTDKIKQAYISYVLENGTQPASIFKFVKDLKIKEELFYEHFNSFENVEKQIWLDMFEETVSAISSEEVYEEYSSREKMLAFFYTWIEQLKSKRSFILQTNPKALRPEITPYFLELVRPKFKEWVTSLLAEAQESEEVVDRPVVGKKYDEGIWLQMLFVLGFWIKDDSKGFEKTDAAIEKSVNLAFDLMGRGPLDAMLDFGKFLFQNRG